MSSKYDSWLHGLSIDGTYPCLIQRNGELQIFKIKRSYLEIPTYTVWNGDKLIYSGTSDIAGFKAFRKCESEVT